MVVQELVLELEQALALVHLWLREGRLRRLRLIFQHGVASSVEVVAVAAMTTVEAAMVTPTLPSATLHQWRQSWHLTWERPTLVKHNALVLL